MFPPNSQATENVLLSTLSTGCLNTDPSTHLRRMGVPPKPQTLSLQCPLIVEGQTQTVIIMYIPPPNLRDFEERVSQSTKDVLQSAYAAR